MFSLTPLEQLRSLDQSSSEFHNQVCNVLYGKDYQQWVNNLQGSELVGFVDYLDKALDVLDAMSFAFRECLRQLRNICGERLALPTSYIRLSLDLTVNPRPFASRGFSDMYEGILDGLKVRVKRARVYSAGILYKEAIVWKRLKHKNIVPLFCVTIKPLQLISEPVLGEDLREYIGKFPDTNRFGLLAGVAEGVHFLHSHSIVHGALRGKNVLVDRLCRARIADFGFAAVARDLDSTQDTLDDSYPTVRWTAPEILMYRGKRSKEADVFAFAMVMIETFTGAVPFDGSQTGEVMIAIMWGKRPPRPAHSTFTGDLWALMQRCWDQAPQSRLEVFEILKALSGVVPVHTLCKLESHSLPSFLSLEQSIEIPAAPSTSGADSDKFTPSPAPQGSGDIGEECQSQMGQEFIDGLDKALDNTTCDRDRERLLNTLCKLCSRQRMMPVSMYVKKRLIGELVEADCGGYATVFRTRYKDRQVAVKTMRICMSSNFDERLGQFCREAVAWRHLRHPNILPLLGVDLEEYRLSMVSEWMDQGNINEFVKKNGEVNRVQLLVDAANGLEYMHNLNMVHGDLKGANILINRSHRACLADFGLSTIVGVNHHTEVDASSVSMVSKTSLVSFTAGGTSRWMSPELLDPDRFGADGDRPTKQSDSYALGMVVYEVLSGKSPYWGVTNQVAVIYAIVEGYRPRKPDGANGLGFTDELWKTIQQCWLADPNARPDVKAILSQLNHATWSWERRRMV